MLAQSSVSCGVQSVSPLSRSNTFFVSLCHILALTMAWWPGREVEKVLRESILTVQGRAFCVIFKQERRVNPYQIGVGHLFWLRCFWVIWGFKVFKSIHLIQIFPFQISKTHSFFNRSLDYSFEYENLTISGVLYSSTLSSVFLIFWLLEMRIFFIPLHALWLSHLALGWWLTTLSLTLCFYNATVMPTTAFTFRAP